MEKKETHSCVVCLDYGTDCVLIQINRIGLGGREKSYETVDRGYAGIRAICRKCLHGIGSISQAKDSP
jgi:hypothetical protein